MFLTFTIAIAILSARVSAQGYFWGADRCADPKCSKLNTDLAGIENVDDFVRWAGCTEAEWNGEFKPCACETKIIDAVDGLGAAEGCAPLEHQCINQHEERLSAWRSAVVSACAHGKATAYDECPTTVPSNCRAAANALARVQTVDDVPDWAECETTTGKDACACAGKAVDALFAIGERGCSVDCVLQHRKRIQGLVEMFGVRNECGTKACDVHADSNSKTTLWLGSGVVTSEELCVGRNIGATHLFHVATPRPVNLGFGDGDVEMWMDVDVAHPNLGCCTAECTVFNRRKDRTVAFTPGLRTTADSLENNLTGNKGTTGSLSTVDGQMCYSLHDGDEKTFLDSSKSIWASSSSFDLWEQDATDKAYCCVMMPCQYLKDFSQGFCIAEKDCGGTTVPGKCPDPSSNVKCCDSWEQFGSGMSQGLHYSRFFGSLNAQLSLYGRDDAETTFDPARREGKTGTLGSSGAASLSIALTAAAVAVVGQL